MRLSDAAGGALDQLEAEAVTLIAGVELGADGEIAAIGRVDGGGVRAGIGGGEIGGASVGRGEGEGEYIAIGGCGQHRVEVAGEGDLAAIGRELVLVLPAERKGRYVMVAGGEVARDAGFGAHRRRC